MIIPDVNPLIHAHRNDSVEHDAYAAWLRRVIAGPAPVGLSELVLFGFIRIVTNRRVFQHPTTPMAAFAFVQQLIDQPHVVRIRPAGRHWSIFQELCKTTVATDTLVSDAHHAALVIEHGGEWLTNDADFARFPGLRWRHPLS
jgi:uncharacterized protein